MSLVTVDYNDLLLKSDDPSFNSKKLSSQLTSAFGPDSLGIICISNIPNFLKFKREVLELTHRLASLPDEYKEEILSDVDSYYNGGWSYGKEKLGDKPDYSKASFYFNPITDVPGTPELRKKYPASYPCNKWPTDLLPQLEPKGKQLGSLMKDVVAQLARHVDTYIQSKCPSYKAILATKMRDTEKVKGRLLYYYPHSSSSSSSMTDSWIGWHNDSGFFTALAGDAYIDHTSGDVIDASLVDPNAGLYVMNRNGDVTKVTIPEDVMAVQIGECLQIISGGCIVATPHCVKGADPTFGSGNIARVSFPCFVDMVPEFPLRVPDGCTKEQVLECSVKGCAKVPPLGERWDDGKTFGDFLADTFKKYYEWSTS
jgi:isopenicillin N synthase-like dioxygenase